MAGFLPVRLGRASRTAFFSLVVFRPNSADFAKLRTSPRLVLTLGATFRNVCFINKSASPTGRKELEGMPVRLPFFVCLMIGKQTPIGTELAAQTPDKSLTL